MITAIDTNIISAIWNREPSAVPLSNLLNDFLRAGALVVHGTVWAELSASRKVGHRRATELLEQLGIRIELEMPRAGWELAADAFAVYAERRRGSGAGHPRRLLADFLVGAHASVKSDRLCTADGGFYRSLFPSLRLVAPPE